MILPGSAWSILPSFAPSIKQLAATKWPSHDRGPAVARSRLARLELLGVLGPAYMGRFRQSVTQAAADPSVPAIVVFANSPGGTCDGAAEAAECVRRAAQIKPVTFLCEGYLCSGCYFIACQATSIIASPSTVVGSIGTILTLVDESDFWAAMGIKFLNIATGINKTCGYPGQPILEEHVAMIQRLIDHDQAAFEVAIERGRKLTPQQMAKVNDGSVFSAGRAKNLGLVDEIAMWEDVLPGLEERYSKPREEFSELTGRAALAKFFELAVQLTEKSDFVHCEDFEGVPAWARNRIAEKHPRLVAAAEKSYRSRFYTGDGMHVPRH